VTEGGEILKYFSSVEETFMIQGRGCVIMPAWPPDFDFKLRSGDSIQLRNPSQVLDTQIASIEFVKVVAGPSRIAFLLPGDIAKSDVPPQTEIWIEDSKSALSPTR
jgi:hypothetical protein